MRADESHFALFDAGDDFVHQFVFDLAVLFVAPPDEDVRAVEQFVTDALVGVAQAGGDDFPAIDLERFKALGDGKINVLRINILRAGIDVGRAFGPDHDFAFARGGEGGWGHQYACGGGSAKGQRGAAGNATGGSQAG